MNKQQPILIEQLNSDVVNISGSVVEFVHLVNRLYDFVKNKEEKIMEEQFHLEPVTELDDHSLALTIKLVTDDYFHNLEDHILMQISSSANEVMIVSNLDGLYYFMQLLIEMLEACKTKKKEEMIEMLLERGVWILSDSLSLAIKIK